MEFNPKINILVGENEAGKITILEAIKLVLNQTDFSRMQDVPYEFYVLGWRNFNGSPYNPLIVLLNPCNMSQSQIDDILQDDAIPKLIFSGANKYLGRYINWSYSKSDTFDDVCVILTEKTNSICDKDWSFTLTDVVRNKLYVALTRARHNVYLLSWEEFKRISRY